MRYRERRNGGTRTAGPTPSPRERALLRGLEHHQAGRLPDAEAIYRQVLADDPNNAPVLHLLGALANQVGQPTIAIELISQAIQIEPSEASYHNNLGVAYQNLGRLEEAADCYERALARLPDYVDALINLGMTRRALGRLDVALDSFELALKIQPNNPETLNSVGALLMALGRFAEAETRIRRALKLRPDGVPALMSLSGVLIQTGRSEEALAVCRQAVALAPADARTHDLLGTILRATGLIDEALVSYQHALTLSPDSANLYLNLATTLQVAGRSADAAVAYRQSLALNPASAIAHSGLIFALDLQPGAAAEARVERRRWNDQFGQAWRHQPLAHVNDPRPDRPLRIGYVSADFYHHSASTVIMPILRAHDRSQIQVYCYSGVTAPDAITAEARALADGWHDVAYLSDSAVDALIRADQIDVLVDLSGHSAGNRLPVFARKPAPIQVTAWGYATGTGLDAIDAFLIDRVVVPAEERGDYAEAIVELPSPVCFEPPSELPPISPLPALTRGYVTFGVFNRLSKASSQARDSWADVLAIVPDSRLLIKTGPQDTDEARQQLVDDLVARGVARERIELRRPGPRLEHLAAHADVDLALDAFPATGGVTTAEALLMGVPVVTLFGDGVAGRLSASFLTSLKLPDLIARTTDEYVGIAARLAGQIDRLAGERATLRERFLASPIGDTRAYTRAVEAAYRDLWRRWCASRADELRANE
jgi:predicted O-linked N-acetylglucosamine transferase (SPINDLY family)